MIQIATRTGGADVSVGDDRAESIPVPSGPTSASLTQPMPVLDPAATSEVTVNIDGGGGNTYSFAPSDPMDGSVYMGQASGVAAEDAVPLANNIMFTQGAFCTASAKGELIIVTSLNTGSGSIVTLTGFINGTANGHD